MVTSKKWNFPQSTCERNVLGSVIQPLSFAMNFANAALLTKSALSSHSLQGAGALLSFVLFEIIHTVSHMVHMSSNLHELSIHACGYLMATTMWSLLQKRTNQTLTKWEYGILGTSIVTDIIVFSSVRGVYSIFSGLSVMAFTVGIHLRSLTSSLKTKLKFLIGGVYVLAGLFYIEMKYCDDLLNKGFDFHPWIIETWGIVLFQLLASFIEEIDNPRRLSRVI